MFVKSCAAVVGSSELLPCGLSLEAVLGKPSQDSLHPGPSSRVEEAVYSFYLSLLTSAR